MCNSDVIRTQPKHYCLVCGNEGEIAYTGLTDRLFSVPGSWTLRRCKSARCQTHWLDPVPIAEDLRLLYKNYYTHHDTPPGDPVSLLRRLFRRGKDQYLSDKFGYPTSSSTIGWILARLLILSPERRANLDFSVFYLPVHHGGKLLEIGCGSGNMLHAMKQKGWHAKGLDFDSRAVAIARSKGLDVEEGELLAQNYPGSSFDVVVMSHVIEHVPDPQVFLTECARITKRGGKVVVITPNITGSLSEKFKSNFLHLDPPRHLHLFTPRSLIDLVFRSGLTPIQVRTTIRDVAGLYRASNNLLRQGHHDMIGRVPSIWCRAYGYYVSLVENMKLHRDPLSGSEIVAIVTREE